PVGADGQRVEPQDRVQPKLFTATGGDHRDLVDPPGTVGPPAQVHDRVDGVVHLVADRVVGHVPLTHGGKGLQPVDGVLGGVGVHGHQRPVVAGVHGVEHVYVLRTTHLTDDDAVGPHTQGVTDQITDGDLAAALDVGRPGLQAYHVFLHELEFGGVLDGDDAFGRGDKRRHRVEERGL